MLRQFKSMMLCAVVAILGCVGIQGQSVGQVCSDCAGAPACGSSYGTSCDSGRCVGHGQVRDSIHQNQERRDLISARNDAWPKPFNCVDRQIYEEVWGKYINAGYERQCCLSSMHFDPQTGKLNAFGRTIVSGLVQNMPQAHKTVFVNRDSDEDASQQHLENVREFIEYAFGNGTSAQVAFTNQEPMRVSALRVERLQGLEFEATPVPIIPIASGTTSVASGAGGN